MKSDYLKKFLGVRRWSSLYHFYKSNSKEKIEAKLSTIIILLCLLISFVPIFSSIFLTPDFATVIFGSICVIAILIRNNLNFPPIKFYKNINRDLAITHTAFAFGCIPAVFLLLLSPETITQHSEVISQTLKTAKSATSPPFWEIAIYITSISLWIALLEEVVYRGLLLSALRRWKIFNESPLRDVYAISISAIIFGFAHYHSWGLYASLSVVGLGIGFGIAYICTKEKLLPLILYHFFFDLISFTVIAISQ